jgi:sulfatase maturation enzyme AslB (radical SAM superfamily)
VFWEQIADSVDQLRYIEFTGGEPFMIQEHFDMLQRLVDQGVAHRVEIHYNTNGTQYPKGAIDIWRHFKTVEIAFSIDDVGERFNYQRTGADWSEVENNLKWYHDNMPHNHMFNINCVWGYLNLFYLDELVEWHQTNFSRNRHGDPTHLIFQKAQEHCSINHLSQSVYNTLIQKFQNYPQLLDLISTLDINDQSHDTFWKFVDSVDTVRNTQYKKIFPEWSKLIS